MKDMGIKSLPLASVVAGETFNEVRELRCVSELIHELRTANKPDSHYRPIVVRSRDNRVASGEDVLAAHVALNSPTVRVHAWDLDEDEFIAVRVADQARMRMGREAARTARFALLELVEGRQERSRANARDSELRKAGVTVPATPASKSSAREMVAGLLGVSSEALRKAEARKVPRAPREPHTEWQLDLYGNVATASLLVEAKEARNALELANTSIITAQRMIGRLRDGRFGQARHARLATAASDLGELVRSYYPSRLCPWCKDVAAVREVCMACWHSGFVSEAKFAEAPEELTRFPCVAYGGRYIDPLTMKPYALPTEPMRRLPDDLEEIVEYDTAAEPELADSAFPGIPDSEVPISDDWAEPTLDDWPPPDPTPADIEYLRDSCEIDEDLL